MNQLENARTEQPEQSATNKYEQEIAEAEQAESQRSAEALAQSAFNQDTMMLEMGMLDDGDPPGIIIGGNYSQLGSNKIGVNGINFDRDGVNMQQYKAQLGSNRNYGPLGLEASLMGIKQNIDYQYLQGQTSRFSGYGGGLDMKLSLGIGGRRCIQCDTGSNRGIGAFASLGINKVRADGKVVCDCPGNIIHQEALTLTNIDQKIGIEIESPSGVKIQGYRQKTRTGYAFWNDDFRLYMQGRGVGATIPLNGRD